MNENVFFLIQKTAKESEMGSKKNEKNLVRIQKKLVWPRCGKNEIDVIFFTYHHSP